MDTIFFGIVSLIKVYRIVFAETVLKIPLKITYNLYSLGLKDDIIQIS